MACDTALVVQLCKLYDLPMGGPAARRLMQRLSGHNAMLGGVQLGLQLALSGLRQLLLIAAPFFRGLEPRSSGPRRRRPGGSRCAHHAQDWPAHSTLAGRSTRSRAGGAIQHRRPSCGAWYSQRYRHATPACRVATAAQVGPGATGSCHDRNHRPARHQRRSTNARASGSPRGPFEITFNASPPGLATTQ